MCAVCDVRAERDEMDVRAYAAQRRRTGSADECRCRSVTPVARDVSRIREGGSAYGLYSRARSSGGLVAEPARTDAARQ